MARPGAGKRKMAAQRKKEWNNTVKSLKSTGRCFKIKKRRKKKACYVATCVYGSYDCPQVWVLRRYRDFYLRKSVFGRLFISVYYAISPQIVKLFGNTVWFKRMWRVKLDRMVEKLKDKGYKSTPYND